MLTSEEAVALDASAPGSAIVLTLVREFRVPVSVHVSNVRSAWRQASERSPRTGGVFICGGVVVREPLMLGEEFFLVEAVAPLSGFFNPAPGVLCAAYGKPILHKAWNVTVGPTVNPAISSAMAIVYETVVFYVQSEYTPPPAP